MLSHEVFPVPSRRHSVLLLICSVAWIGLLAASHAAIGDTHEDLFKRYGAGKEIGGQMLYQVDTFSLSVYFNKDVSSMDVYTRMPNVDGTHDPLSDADIEKLLKIESIANGSWYKVLSKTGQKTWRRTDGKVIARFTPQHINPSDQTTVYDSLVFVDAALK